MNKIVTYRMRTRDEFEKLIQPFDDLVREFTLKLALLIEEELYNLKISRTYYHFNPYYATIKIRVPAIPLTYDESCFVKDTLKNIFHLDLYRPDFDIIKRPFRNQYQVDNIDRNDYM